MKKMYIGRCLFLLLLTLLFVAAAFSASRSQPDYSTPMSFEYSLTEAYVTDTHDVIKQLETYIDNGENSKIEKTVELITDKTNYISHQYDVSKMLYYADLEDEAAYEAYVFSEDAFFAVAEESLRVLKKLYLSDLSSKNKVFEDWTEKELRVLTLSNEEIFDLEAKQNDFVREYLSLDNPGSEEWSVALENIYYEYVKTSQQIALLNDYENYYEYSATEIYLREYTKEQRESFRKNVKEFILPFYFETDSLYQEKKALLNEEQKTLFSSLRKDTCEPSNEYLTGYINTYPEDMKTYMNYLFDRNALMYTTSENAYTTGFTDFSYYCEQPYVFLGNQCQNLLTLIHELGHYTAFYHFDDSFLPYDTCEVHSQGNEWLMLCYLDGKFDPQVYEMFLLWRLRYGLDVIIASTIVDEYEETIYTCEDLTSPEQFYGIMEDILKGYENYEDYMSKDEIYTYAQYVTIEAPVYYLSYATSELASMSLYSVAIHQDYETAQSIYTDLCLETDIEQYFFDTLMDVGLPNPFDVDTVKDIISSFENITSSNMVVPAA